MERRHWSEQASPLWSVTLAPKTSAIKLVRIYGGQIWSLKRVFCVKLREESESGFNQLLFSLLKHMHTFSFFPLNLMFLIKPGIERAAKNNTEHMCSFWFSKDIHCVATFHTIAKCRLSWAKIWSVFGRFGPSVSHFGQFWSFGGWFWFSAKILWEICVYWAFQILSKCGTKRSKTESVVNICGDCLLRLTHRVQYTNP